MAFKIGKLCLSLMVGMMLATAPAVVMAEETGHSPLDYPLVAPQASAALPQPAAPASAPDLTAPRADQKPAALSPLVGKLPLLPYSRPVADRMKADPAFKAAMQAHLKPVAPPKLNAAPVVPGPWTLGSTPAGAPFLNNPLLMMDGTVIASSSCTGTWYKLTPDIRGNYATGTWTKIASTPAGYAPRFFSSEVLPDGRVMTSGGEYNNTGTCTATWTNLAAIYDPYANTWSSVAAPSGWAQIGDSQSIILPNGTYMQADCCDTGARAATLNPSTLAWTATGSGKGDYYDEEAWALTANNKVLTVDSEIAVSCSSTGDSEIYDPATGAWTSAGIPGVQMSDCANPGANPSYEVGPIVQRLDGTLFSFGGNTCGGCAKNTVTVFAPTAYYNPGTTAWTVGPNIPTVTDGAGTNNYTMDDAPGAVEPTGNVLIAASQDYDFNTFAGSHFFELGASTNAFTQVADNSDVSAVVSFEWNFLNLPNGQIMALTTDLSDIWYYTPSGTVNAAAAPIVSSSQPPRLVAGATYKIQGQQLGGLTQGSYYGDDQQMATNYPIVKITNNFSGHAQYARSYQLSTYSITPGVVGTVYVTMPQTIEPGGSTVNVIANGSPSIPVQAVAQPSLTAKAPNFNGDAASDLLWRNADGQIVMWEMGAGTLSSSVGGQSVSTDWYVAGTGDFNSDGLSDILWRNFRTGQVSIWEMNGGTIAHTVGGQVISAAWQIVGTGDFYGAGFNNCILWSNTSTGQFVIWQMNGGTVAKSSALTVPSGFEVVGLGDFNKHGTTDILWRNVTTGATVIWEMSGGAVLKSELNKTVPSNWSVIATGDFYDSGTTDILWRNASGGAIALWQITGGALTGSASVTNVPVDWQIVGVGDYFGVGHQDSLMWRNLVTGQMATWRMNGGTVSASASPPSVAPSSLWSVVR